MFNTFLPVEWVGYDTENGNIIYAQLLHRINTKVSMEEEDIEQSLNRKYLITTGNEPIVVTALQLYKLMSECVPQLESHKTGNSEATGQVEHALQEGGRRPVQVAVTTAWSLPDDQKRKALKRLYLQYHPDKNPSASIDFQYLLQEIEKMEKGYPDEPEHQIRASDSFTSKWNGLFNEWNQTASSHQKFREKDRCLVDGIHPNHK